MTATGQERAGRVAVVGGRGKTGRAVISALGRRGATAVPVGRHEWSDLPAVLSDCYAVYLIAPNLHADEPGFVSEVLTAARAADVTRIGYHSVASPYAPSMPHHLGKARGEDLVRRSGADWTILQPCAYVQNFLPALRSGGPLRVPYALDSTFGLVDLDDVAEAAARILLDAGHAGATYELGGPALVSVTDVGVAAEELLGRPVPVEQITADEWVRTQAVGLDERARGWLLAMFAYYDAHGLPTGPLPLTALLGREPHSVDLVLRRDLAPERSDAR